MGFRAVCAKHAGQIELSYHICDGAGRLRQLVTSVVVGPHHRLNVLCGRSDVEIEDESGLPLLIINSYTKLYDLKFG